MGNPKLLYWTGTWNDEVHAQTEKNDDELMQGILKNEVVTVERGSKRSGGKKKDKYKQLGSPKARYSVTLF